MFVHLLINLDDFIVYARHWTHRFILMCLLVIILMVITLVDVRLMVSLAMLLTVLLTDLILAASTHRCGGARFGDSERPHGRGSAEEKVEHQKKQRITT